MPTKLDSLRQSEPRFADALQQAQRAVKKHRAGGVLTRSAGRAEAPPAFDEAEVDRAAEAIWEGRTEGAFETPVGMTIEAIVRSALRPSFYMARDRILSEREGLSAAALELMEEMDLTFSDRPLFDEKRDMLQQRARAAGRLNLFYGFREYAGSGWLVEPDIAVTNRHVAGLFARARMFDGWDFMDGQFDNKVQVRLDSLQQIETPGERSARVTEILWVAGAGEPDMALLRVANPEDQPIDLYAGDPEPGMPVAVVGYPARDLRDNPQHLMASFFGDRFGVKRFAPGRVTDDDDGVWTLSHDASTLGGNSGSMVIDMATGAAVGLHFAGAAQEKNSAVPARLVKAALAKLKTSLAVPALPAGAAEGDTEASRPEGFADREGYDRGFLGEQVALPAFGGWQADLAELRSAPGEHELRYCHFSVWQSRSRRLPLLTAVNIDGTHLRLIPRSGRWQLDGRLRPEDQVGNVLYRSNPLDRGHMVRRLDPCWAPDLDDDETILKAQADTFHYTNSVPQHEDLNQRDWVGLEDYILDSAGEHGFRLSVLTGPVFRDDDRPLRNQQGAADIAIPREFWKVAVMRRQSTGALSATGYVLSHGEMIRTLTEAEFVLGAYETYQVPLRLIEEATGLDFGPLKDADPLAVASPSEAVFHASVRPVRGPSDLVLG